jgi:hypothetical protein
VKVTVNGEPIARSLLDVPLDRDPGNYVIRAEGGKEPVEQSVTLAAGDQKSVALTVELTPPTAAKATGDTDTPPPMPKEPNATPADPSTAGAPLATGPENETAKGSSSSRRIIAYTTFGVAGAAAIATVVTIAMRGSALSDLNKVCPNHETEACGPDAREPIDRGQRAALMTNIFGALTIVSAAVGVTLLLTEPKTATSSARAARVRLSPFAATSGGGAFLSGEF